MRFPYENPTKSPRLPERLAGRVVNKNSAVLQRFYPPFRTHDTPARSKRLQQPGASRKSRNRAPSKAVFYTTFHSPERSLTLNSAVFNKLAPTNGSYRVLSMPRKARVPQTAKHFDYLR